MREVICINIGQAGAQISSAIWELFCMEHGITASGQLTADDLHSCSSVFHEISENKFVPRCLTIDLEPTVIDEIRTGIYRQLFNPCQLISGLEDSSCNFARGHFTIGRIYVEPFLSSLRRMFEQCDSLQGFMIVQSFGGGSGSGFTALMLEQFSVNHPKTNKMQFSLLPSRDISSAVVEPYNFILSAKSSIDFVDMSFHHDNQSVLKIVQDKLDVKSPSFTSINRLLAQIFSSITVSIRYENTLNNDICQMATNIIPYPRLHYLMDFYAPVCNNLKGQHYNSTTSEITRDVFDLNSKLLDCEFIGQKFISCCLQYRGNISPLHVNQSLFKIKKLDVIRFVDWCPTGFKIGINRSPSVIPKSCEMFDTDNSVLLICNNTSYHQKLGHMISKFEALFKKRSFVHWFVGEGMEEGEFNESKDEFLYLKEDYRCLNDEEENEQSKEIVQDIPAESIAENDAHVTFDPEDVVRKTQSQEDHNMVEIYNDEADVKESAKIEVIYNEADNDVDTDTEYDKSENPEEDDDDDEEDEDDVSKTDKEIIEKKGLVSVVNVLVDEFQVNVEDRSSVSKKINSIDIGHEERLSRLNKFLNIDSDTTRSEISPL